MIRMGLGFGLGNLEPNFGCTPSPQFKKEFDLLLENMIPESGGMNSEIVQGSALSPVERPALLFD